MALRTETDLFEHSTMTFGEHLEELRKCLMKAVIGLVIGTVIGFFLGEKVVDLIEAPLKGALKRYYTTQAEVQYVSLAQTQLAAGLPIPYTLEEVREIAKGDPDSKKPELIYEVKYTHQGIRVPAVIPTIVDAPPVDLDTLDPKIKGDPNAAKRHTRENLEVELVWHPIEADSRFNMQATGVTEPFSVWLKASLVVGVVLSSPWVFYHLWTFVAAGLYSHERKYVYTYMPFSIGLFLAGAALAYLAVFQPVLDFLFAFNKDLGIDPDPKIGEWLSFVLILPLGFGISFQLPLVMLFLERIGVFSIESYMKNWRIAVLVIFVLSAVLTPADPYSLLFMAVPLTFLYFGGVLLAKYLPHNKPAVELAKR